LVRKEPVGVIMKGRSFTGRSSRRASVTGSIPLPAIARSVEFEVELSEPDVSTSRNEIERTPAAV